VLLHGYLISDFSISNVANNSHTAKPLIYKISGVWGNHEGSMMLWILVMALFGCTVGWFGGNLRPTLRARTIAIQGLIGAAFIAFILFTSNPFSYRAAVAIVCVCSSRPSSTCHPRELLLELGNFHAVLSSCAMRVVCSFSSALCSISFAACAAIVRCCFWYS